MMLCLRSGGFHRSFFIHPSGNICSKIEHLQGLDKLPWPLRPQQEGRLDHDQRVHGVLSQDQPKGPHFLPWSMKALNLIGAGTALGILHYVLPTFYISPCFCTLLLPISANQPGAQHAIIRGLIRAGIEGLQKVAAPQVVPLFCQIWAFWAFWVAYKHGQWLLAVHKPQQPGFWGPVNRGVPQLRHTINFQPKPRQGAWTEERWTSLGQGENWKDHPVRGVAKLWYLVFASFKVGSRNPTVQIQQLFCSQMLNSSRKTKTPGNSQGFVLFPTPWGICFAKIHAIWQRDIKLLGRHALNNLHPAEARCWMRLSEILDFKSHTKGQRNPAMGKYWPGWVACDSQDWRRVPAEVSWMLNQACGDCLGCHSIYSTHTQHESGDHQGPCRMIRHSWQRIANHYHILKFRRFTMHSTGSWEEIKWAAVGGQAFDEDSRRQACTSAILVQGLRICEFNAGMEKRKDPVEKGILLSPKSHPEKLFTMQYCIVFVYEHVPKIELCMILGEFAADPYPLMLAKQIQTILVEEIKQPQAITLFREFQGVMHCEFIEIQVPRSWFHIVSTIITPR